MEEVIHLLIGKIHCLSCIMPRTGKCILLVTSLKYGKFRSLAMMVPKAMKIRGKIELEGYCMTAS